MESGEHKIWQEVIERFEEQAPGAVMAHLASRIYEPSRASHSTRSPQPMALAMSMARLERSMAYLRSLALLEV